MPVEINAALPPIPPVIFRPEAARVAKAINLCQVAGTDHHIPLFRAAGQGRLAFTALTSGHQRPNLYKLGKAGLPSLILVGDDDGYGAGPARWNATPRLLRWAASAVVHATGGDQPTYALAVEMAALHDRLLLIETGTQNAPRWISALQDVGVPTLHIKSRDGGFHPVSERRGGMH